MALDLSGMSDTDLAAVASGDMSKVSDAGLAIINPAPKSATATFIDQVGKHIGIPGTNLDLDAAAKAMTRGINAVTGSKFDTGTSQEDVASAAANPTAATAGNVVGSTIGLGAAGTALNVASKGAQAAWNARKLAILQEQAAKINAAQDAAHIARVSEALEAGSGESAMARANRALREDYVNERTALRTPPSQVAGEEGGPQWFQSGAIPKAPKDMSPADLAALDRSARDAAVQMAKQPFVQAMLQGKGTAGKVAQGGLALSALTGAGYGVYHTYRALQWLSRLLTE